MQIAVLGIDLGKNSCSVVGLDASGRVVLRRRLQRDGVVKFAAGLPGCVMAMEACCGAHHLGRLLRGQGHQVRLMSPEYVRPYVKAQKNDDRDAEAIAEAATRPTMRFVELKSEAQLDMQMPASCARPAGGRANGADQPAARVAAGARHHRAAGAAQAGAASRGAAGRDEAAAQPADRGCWSRTCAPSGASWTGASRPSTTSSPRRPGRMRPPGDWQRSPASASLNATALVAAIGNAETFARGRDLAAWLGLVPRQVTTGGKPGCSGSASGATGICARC